MKPPEVVVLNPLPRRPTVDDLLGEFEEARQVALEQGLPGVAVSATAWKAKMLGMIINRVDVQKSQSFDHMTIDQTIQAIKNELGPDAAKALTHYVRQLERKVE